jgi:hypothetical protein
VTLTVVAPVAPSAVLRESLTRDSPADCRRCGSPMLREVGPWDDPDTRGNPIVDEQDVCLSCGYRWPAEQAAWSPAEIRRRVQIVQAHRAVTDHTRCGPGQPCQVSRPGIPSVPPISPAMEVPHG